MSVRELEARIASHPLGSTPEAQKVLRPAKFDEKAYDRERKAKQRAIGRELYIPAPKNLDLRAACLDDPELLLTTYFSETYFEPFTDDRRDMLRSIWRAAKYGGDQAIAAPRGEGKTTLAMDGAFCLMLAGLTFFPVIIAKNQDASSDELKALRERILASERFIEDFPEIGIPLQAVGPSTANARLQTVGGKFIGMFLGVKHFGFPTISRDQLPHWPGIDTVANGQVMGAVGIEGRIRGFKFRSRRPTLGIIDDVEDRDSANNDETIAKNERIIEEDIGGMGASARRIARLFLCTTLNRRCNAFRYTDPKQKPSWNGRRYKKMIKPPDRMDLVQEYIEMRRMRSADDPDARAAFRFWLERKDIIEAGCVVSNAHSFNGDLHADGFPLELSTCHAYYNRVADTNETAVATEIDNDPPDEAGPIGVGLTADLVASRLSGLSRYQLPANTTAVTAAIDLGKHRCHWVVCAWWPGAGGVVVDYGIVEVTGNESIRYQDKAEDMEASEPAVFRALVNWRDELLVKRYVDATGVQRQVNHVLVDSGAYTNAAYEFVRQVRGVFHCSKGMTPYRRQEKNTKTIRAGRNIHAHYLESSGVWLHELDTSYWKQWVHERFLTPTFDEQNMLRRGSLSLYTPEGKSRHNTYSQHIVAEELLTEFKEGKGAKSYWYQKQDNNHWLDATYMAAACTELVGLSLITPSEASITPKEKPAATKPQPRQHGNFRTRPGGWLRGIKRR